MQHDELLTVREAATLLKVTPNWIYERTRLNAIPMRKIGGHVRIPRNELAEWVNKQTPFLPEEEK